MLNWLRRLLDQLQDRLVAALFTQLSQVPPGFAYLGYVVFAICLTGWVKRHIPMIPLDPDSPMFRQPGGARLWMRLSWFRLLLVLGAAGIGFILPEKLADFFWRNPYTPDADVLGPLGRIAELVGLVCGFRIGWHCQYQLNLLMLIGLLGWFLLNIGNWVVGN